MMHQLIEKMFVETFKNPLLDQRHDAAVLSCSSEKIAFTTDSYVINPLFFPGGNIGQLAVCGTVNDLAMAGACPKYLSVGFVLEEGLPVETLWQIVRDMQATALECGVQIVTGDTKVVDRGKADKIFINTAGIGILEYTLEINPREVREGDAVIVSGDVGRHGMAVMAVREGLSFESDIESDVAPLSGLIHDILSEGIHVHCLRDLTRGGLASALNEISQACQCGIHIEEAAIPVEENVHGACEMLGFDPIYVACEGRFAAFVPSEEVQKTLDVMRGHPSGQGACVIGEVRKGSAGVVTMKSKIGVDRIVDMLSGEQLPRIC